MRKSKQETAATRIRIVESAAAEFRRDGILGTGLNDFMAAAGLTRGGFYRHFSSKNQLVKEALAVAFDEQTTRLIEAKANARGKQALAAAVDLYLSPPQRDDPSRSCPLAMLGSELARCDEEVRRTVTDGFLQLANVFSERHGGASEGEARRRGMLVAATMMGALLMSRITTDRQLSDTILADAKSAVLAGGRPRLGPS